MNSWLLFVKNFAKFCICINAQNMVVCDKSMQLSGWWRFVHLQCRQHQT